MCRIKYGVFTSIICMLFSASLVVAHTPKDPNFLQPEIQKEWLTLRTAHFNFHYEAPNKAMAVQMARVAERIHNQLTQWLEWEPATATEVVVLDSVDFSNGRATPFPYNRLQIYLPTPIEGELMDHSPWLDRVFIHEYLHILQLDMARGAPARVRDIFGRLGGFFTPFSFPQLFAPSWVAEGLAVYGESDNSEGFGRLNSAWYEAAMRMEVQRGLRSLTEVSYAGYSGVRWPYGQIYLYGAYFMQFIEAKYGRDAIRRYFLVYSSNLIPWRMDSRSYQVFGQSAKAVWQAYQTYLKQQFEPQLAQLKAHSGEHVRVIVDEPYESRLLTRSAAGDLYYYHDDAQSAPTVRLLRESGEHKELFSMQRVNHLDWHDASGLLISREAVCENSRLYTDLYLWHPEDGEIKRLTECGRYRIAAWRPDGKAIAALQLDKGESRLVLLSDQGDLLNQLALLPEGDVLGGFSWSPDGHSIVASVKRLLSGWNIERLNIQTGEWQHLTKNSDLEIRPLFSADRQHIVFISDHGGVWNVRQLKLDNGEVTTLSNTLSAVTEVLEMPDHHFRLVEYRADGMAITELGAGDNQQAAYSAVATEPYQVQPLSTLVAPLPDGAQEQVYKPWESMRPRAWFPLAVVNSDDTSYAGVSLQGEDVLGFHRWSITPLYYYDQNELGGMAYYSFDDRLTFTMQRQLIYGLGRADNEYIEDERRAQLLFNHWLNGVDRSYSVAAGLATERSDVEQVKGTDHYLSVENTLSAIILGYDSTDYYRRSISLEDGRRFKLTVESYDLVGNSDHAGETYRADWSEYLSLGAGQVLKFRMMFAQGDSTIAPYKLGGEVELLSELGGMTELGLRNFPLRGFASGGNELTGSNMGLLSVEWRYPLGFYQDGWFVPPIGLGRHSLTLFADSGDAWGEGEHMEPYTGIGAEWSAELLLGYNMIHIGVTIGAAHGLGTLGDDRLYIKLGSPL